MSGKRREVDRILRMIRQQGADVTRTNAGHWRVRTDAGVVFLAASPSDPRAKENIRRDLRRIGLTV
jgi:hypothetical protein